MPKVDRERLQKDLNQVQHLDRELLPQIPLVPGWEVGLHYRPSRILSGDFYDVRAEDSRVTLLLGDSIRELVLHIVAWENEAIRRLNGAGHDLPPEEDWPHGADAWTELVDELDASHTRLVEALGALDDSRLDGAVMGTGGTVYHLLHGVVQHNLYHGGQIALLRRAASV